MTTNLVSIVIPCRNASRTLPLAIDSLLAQSHKEIEIILVDDNIDAVESERLQYCANKDPRIKIFKPAIRSKVGYIGELLNFGIEKATGDIICRQDADDFSLPNRIQKQLEQLNEMKLDLIGGQSIDVDYKFSFLSASVLPINRSQISRYQAWENPFVHSSVMFTKSSFLETGKYSEELSTSQDYDLWIRYFLKGKEIQNSRHPVVICMKSKSSVSELVDKSVWRSNNALVKAKIQGVTVTAKRFQRPVVLNVRQAIKSAIEGKFSIKSVPNLILHTPTLIRVTINQAIGYYHLLAFRRKNHIELIGLRGKIDHE
jgi:glycosyltransferase involved in cell wall biosynthesis